MSTSDQGGPAATQAPSSIQPPAHPAIAPPAPAPAPSEAEAALAEDQPKRASFRDIDLVLPAKLPATIVFDMADLTENPEDLAGLRRFLQSILGAEQLAAVRNKIAADGDLAEDFEALMREIGESILAPYGMSLGESQASAASSVSAGT